MRINWTNSKGLKHLTQSLLKCLFKRQGEEGWVAILDLRRLKGSKSQVQRYNAILDIFLNKPAIGIIFEPTRDI